MTSSAVIDFEGYQLPSGYFIVKELAFYAVRGPHFSGSWTFQPPMPFEDLPSKQQDQFLWISHNIHHMDWKEGQLPYEKFRSILTLLFEVFPTIYIKGLQKQKFLEFLSGRYCINLEDVNCPKI